MIVLYGWFW